MRMITVTLPDDAWPVVLDSMYLAAAVKKSEYREVAERAILDTHAVIRDQVNATEGPVAVIRESDLAAPEELLR